MEEQQEGSKQIGEALKLMNDNASEVRYASHEMTEGNRAILTEVDQLRQTTDKISSSAGTIRDTGDALAEIANNVEAAVGQIGDQIDLFTV